MTETQKRIRAYKRALPHMKERVIAVALLLAMSVSMMTSATFAWITLSTNPEVSSLATTIATNGNLEIALSDTDGLEPDETAIGDGGQVVTLSNLTWGNLINLSDASYGLDQLVLRPASLNTRDLISSPVSAVTYGADGRVIDRTNDFAFSNYDSNTSSFVVPTEKDEISGEEKNTTQYGVRAVSSVTYKDVSGNTFLIAQMDQINKDYTNAVGLFQSIYKSDAYMKTVGYLVGIHVSYVLGDADVLVDKSEVLNLKTIADVFYDSMYYAGCTITSMINLHQYLNLTDETQNQFHEYTFEELFMVNYDGTSTFTTGNINNTVLEEYEEWIDAIDNGMDIDTYRQAWVKTVNFRNGVDVANAKSEVYWAADLMKSVNLLCDMDSATLNGLTASQMAADMINQAIAIMSADEDDHVAVIHKGALKDADQLLDGDLYVNSGKVEITVVVPESIKEKVKEKLGALGAAMVPDVLTLKPEISTSAEPPAILATDYQTANKRASGGSSLKGVAVAADTYAMAVDFWVRTNVSNSLLILEGETEVDLNTGEVIGYSGVNRVWSDLDDETTDLGAMIHESGGISTTQGSGSCYVFYAESPEQQSQSLNMLQAMRVAFINADGELLAVAEMDVDSKVEDSGRVIVPLKLRNKNAYELEDGTVVTDSSGEAVTRYIQAMPQNEAQRITALIYLDGEILTNSEVLEAGTIKGQLNIQFGTTEMQMDPMEDDEVMQEYYTISFMIDNQSTLQKEFDSYDPENCTIRLKMSLEGTDPTTVKGNFLSIINQTQGARQEEFTMTKDEDGYWVADVSFSGPGNYELRSIQLDGVDIALKGADTTTGDPGNIVKVTINGVAISSLNCTGWDSDTYSVRTADSYYQQAITLSLDSSEFHNVRGIFIGDNGQNVSVNFAYQNGAYRGTATFNSGGTYKMTYLEVDGSVMPLPESMYKTISLQLGLKAYVTVGRPALVSGEENEDILKEVKYDAASGWSFIYNGEEDLEMSVNVVITDDQGNKLTNLEGLELYYGVPGSDSTIDTDLDKWDYSAGGYVGKFAPFRYSGVYQFRYVKLDTQNYISTAASAPTITSIPPDIMEYVNQDAYATLTNTLGQTNTSRTLNISLKNGNAANLYVTLTKYDAEGEVSKTVVRSSKVDGEVQRDPDADKITTFAVTVPEDGNWQITGLEVDTVFYKSEDYPDGKFFSGAAIYAEDGTTVTGYDRLDLTDLVVADDIGTYFLTEIEIKVENAPSATYSGEFMTAHEVNDMTIAVNNQGRPLATILAEVAEMFKDDDSVNIDPTVTVGMVYDWDEKDIDYTYSDSNLPNAYVFGSSNLTLTTNDNGTGYYSLGSMNFDLAGKYYPSFSLSIGGVSYGGSYPTELDRQVEVSWTQPDVTITDVTGAQFNSNGVLTGYESFSVNLEDDGDDEWAELSGVTNYFENTSSGNYANVYISGTAANTYSVPYVKMKLTNIGEAESAYFGFKNNQNRVYTFTSEGEEVSNDIGYLTQGSLAWWRYYRSYIGEQKITEIKMVDKNGVVYTVDLQRSVTVKQDAKPLYLQYTSDNANVEVPDTVVSPDGRAYTFNLATVTPWTLQLTDYESSGTPNTSSSTVYEYSYAEKKWAIITYYNYHYKVYSRETTVTEALTTTIVDNVTYSVVRWKIGNAEPNANDLFTIKSQHVAEAIVEEINRVNISTTTKNQKTTVIKDTLTNSDYNNGTSKRTSDVVTVVYTSDLYPNGYSYTEDLS